MTVPTAAHVTGPQVTGIVLAAGAGTRLGGPKALRRAADGEPWLVRACAVLLGAGCDQVVVVLGSGADAARELVPTAPPGPGGPPAPPITVIVAEQWAQGMSASLRAGLAAATGDAALVTLVDLPGLPAGAARRVLAAGPVTPVSLRQAVYAGRPGHPVLIGRAHWPELARELAGDRGARAYLAAHGAQRIECGDLFDGRDVDEPADLT
ncbi:nucleotidyltransferase family protein [Pengzhenrongella sicca]|uniref:Nucleotidyltransferase family protein n=1 Tax=Pengzhenrongella sicca TaxID=2819238 RepID=A0A8A4Z9T7_9MICO|nr:nucleotidyltransferase family protein [Pengzhenrongella sicca]QTE28235.1 nucleotidyltransferase family protein [Pengzhenrongella sicca]